ncbi:hypothetical protein OKW96_18990 [Sphingobacterium sp. KU25419]|nr:hypothetical protein OKW96_18990 [Sphingobacterium sp. KU25419]
MDHIQSTMINEAKIMLCDHRKQISEVAQQLGFSYQQHFTRLFKQKRALHRRLTEMRIKHLLKNQVMKQHLQSS